MSDPGAKDLKYPDAVEFRGYERLPTGVAIHSRAKVASGFIDATENQLQPKREWVGWMAVARVNKIDEKNVDVAGRLVDMDEMDRGMLGLYLSTQPLAA